MILTHADCKKIHESALNVLNDLGVRVDDPNIVKLMQDAGAVVASDHRVRIPATLVEWALQQAPHQIKIADRLGHLWQLGTEGGTLVLTGNALYITRGRVRSDSRRPPSQAAASPNPSPRRLSSRVRRISRSTQGSDAVALAVVSKRNLADQATNGRNSNWS